MMELLNEFLSGSVAWGVLLTLAAFALGALVNRVTGKAFFNPLLLGAIFVIVFLSVCGISYADYKVSAAPVNYLLLPATISLAIPLYEKWDLLKENAAAINIPTGGTEENTKIAAVVFEEAREANPATSTQPEASKASVNNVAIKTEPADAVAKEDIIIAIPNPSTDANLGYFDPENMEVESSEAPATRAAAKTVGFNNNNYIITIPQGEKIAGKYSPRVKFTKQAAALARKGSEKEG